MLPIPIGTDRPQRRFAWMNISIIAANVVIFAVGQTLAQRTMSPEVRAMGIPPEWFKYMLNPGQLHLYQFITYQFLHQGLAHVGFNMLFLYVFGNNLNEKLGHLGYLMFYLAGGVLAGCGQVLTSDAQTLGASGAISAVTGLFLVLLPRIHIRMFIWFFIYVDVWEIPAIYFILFKVAQDVYEQMAGGANVAYMAHISGAAAGAIIGLLLLTGRLVQRDHYDLLAMINRFRRRQEYRSIVARGYDPFRATQAQPPTRGESGRRGPGGAAGKSPSGLAASSPVADPRIQSLRDEISRLSRLHELSDATRCYLELRQIDSTQVLPPQEQLDIANQLMSDGQHAAAAAAYEDYLRTYPTAPQQEQITLILALIYGRYLPRPDRARELLKGVLPRLHNAHEREMAEAELRHLEQTAARPPA